MAADTCPNACGRCHRCAEEITRLRARVAELEARLEMDHCFALGPTGEMVREEIPPAERSFFGDGIDCRDATIRMQDENITRLRSENASLRADVSRYVSRDTERLAEVEKLREALKPFGASFVAENVDDHGWTSNIHREQISVWFGPSDFRRARAVLTGMEAPQEENVTEPLGEAHFSDPKPLG